MTRKTGWPQEMFLMQDDCSKLSRWFASRIDARETVRRVFRKEDMTQNKIKELAGHRDVSPWVIKLVADAVKLERESCAKLCEGLTNYRVGSVRADFAAAIRAKK